MILPCEILQLIINRCGQKSYSILFSDMLEANRQQNSVWVKTGYGVLQKSQLWLTFQTYYNFCGVF